MKECENKNSVKLYEYYDSEEQFIIVMELCDENLKDFCKRKKETFNINEIYNLLIQLNNAFKIMKKNKIVHRDLKLENILIKYENIEKNNYTFKLTDYGISKKYTTLYSRFSTKINTLNSEFYST